MNRTCTLRGFRARDEGDYGDIHMVFLDPAIGVLPDLSDTRFLLKDGRSPLFKNLSLDDQEDARRFADEVTLI